MNTIRITDVTLTTVPFVKQKEALMFCRLMLEIGISRIEMTSSAYRMIEGKIEPGFVSLQVASLEEFVFFKGRGVRTFCINVGSRALKHICSLCNSGTELTLILPYQAKDSESTLYSETSNSNIYFRLCGFDHVMSGDYSSTFAALTGQFGQTVCFDPGNANFTATAAALEFLHTGGERICTSFCGFGRHAATEQLLQALNLMEGSAFNLTCLPRLRSVFEKITNLKLPEDQPVIGSDIFVYESGIHADGIGKSPKTYEPFEPCSVGANRSLAIGKHSGKSAIRQKLLEAGITPQEAFLPALNRAVREQSEQLGRGLSDSEFIRLYNCLCGETRDI